MQYYVLILLIEYFILRLYVGMTGPGFYTVRGEREIERDRSQQLRFIRICISWLQVFSVLCAAMPVSDCISGF